MRPRRLSQLLDALSLTCDCRCLLLHRLPKFRLRNSGRTCASLWQMLPTEHAFCHCESRPTPNAAGMLTYASRFAVPPGKPSHRVTSSCCYAGFEPLRALGYRVHTHELGR